MTMDAYYVVPPATKFQTISTATKARAVALGCSLCTGDPSGKATAWPSAIVLSTVLAPVVFADTAGQATVTEISAAKTAAQNAEAAAVTNTTTLSTRVKAAIAANITWLNKAATATFPLTTAEQRSLVNHVETLTKQVNALGKLYLDLVTTTTGT